MTRGDSLEYPAELTDAPLAGFIGLAQALSGIKLTTDKRPMLYTRLLRRLRVLKVKTFEEYLALLQRGDVAELEVFVNIMTTNLTYFYRENHHFEYLERVVAPTLFGERGAGRPVRIWSAGCSSGEEPISIAMSLAAAGYTDASDYRLLCTDLNTEMVERTTAGVYRTESMRGLSSTQLKQCFERLDEHHHRIKPMFQRNFVCKRLNLFDRWPFAKGVDVLFCRNVLIYFEASQQVELIRRFADYQNEGAYLFLGHSENIREVNRYYDRVGNTVFRRLERQAKRA